ncbi:MAG: hypothetical protein ACI8RD_005119, partial [Bacillariaceae sp.]
AAKLYFPTFTLLIHCYYPIEGTNSLRMKVTMVTI